MPAQISQNNLEDYRQSLDSRIWSANPFDQNQVNERKHVPLLQSVNLDLTFARIGTLAQLARVFLSGIFNSHRDNDPTSSQTRVMDIVDDFLHKIRQQSQYSIHAQPGLGLRKPDDISSDMVENLVSAKLGQAVYSSNAFIAPWLSVFKMFFPYSEKPILGLIPRLVDFTDNAVFNISNLFWSFRRIAKAFVAYDGGISSEAFIQKQNEINELVTYVRDNFIVGPIKNLFGMVSNRDLQAYKSGFTQAVTKESQKRISGIWKEMLENFWNNLTAAYSKEYKCVHEGRTEKKVGVEEPQNAQWYVRMKLLSKCVGLPVGILSSGLNIASIGMDLLGSLFNHKSLRTLSNKLTNHAMAWMSLVYLTGEVPASLNEFYKKENKNDPNVFKNFYVFMVGVFGMLERLKLLPGFKAVFKAIGIQKFLEKYDKPLSHLYFLFFSYNRLIMHADEKRKAIAKSSNREVEEANKHDNLLSQAVLPIRVLMGDRDVTYSKEDYQRNFTKQAI